MNVEPRSNPVRCIVCLHAFTWADSARCDRCEAQKASETPIVLTRQRIARKR